MRIPELIRKKRDGHALTEGEIREVVQGVTDGSVQDYHLGAFLMATTLRGMTRAETIALTQAMLHSGDVLRLPSIKAPKVDKHSTGGVGDKLTLCLVPLVAACGVAVPMIAGRGLGHTGGTLDKLEAIPGYRTQLSPKRFESVVRSVGASIIGQSERLAPADRRMYAVRDVTATIECIPLIVASILSKKLASGIDGLVLDVKAGRGAFMKDVASARELARALVDVGHGAGKRVRALLTSMEQPIGNSIGNALEVREAIDVLHGNGPSDTTELTFALGVEMLRCANLAKTASAAEAMLRDAVLSRAGLAVFRRMVKAQGGDVRVIDEPDRLEAAPRRAQVRAERAGYVARIDPLTLGQLCVALGGGRQSASDPVDHAVGIQLVKKVGDRVAKGDVLAVLHLPASGAASAKLLALSAFQLATRPPAPLPWVIARFGR